jgi:hypothetical protein
MLVACRLTGLSARRTYYAGVIARAMRADAVPNAASPRVTPRTMRFSQTRQGARFFQHPRAARQRPQPRASKGPTERELQRPSAATGAGRPMATTTSSLPQHPYRICYYHPIGGIFSTEGFQTTIRLPEVPPPPRGAGAILTPRDRGKRKGPPSPRLCPPAAVGTHRVVNHDRRPRVARQPVNERSRPRSLDLVWKDDSSRVP